MQVARGIPSFSAAAPLSLHICLATGSLGNYRNWEGRVKDPTVMQGRLEPPFRVEGNRDCPVLL